MTQTYSTYKNGGGDIQAGALISGKLQDGQKIELTAHELFYGYQHENNQKGVINNEIGAYLFGRSVYFNYQMSSGKYWANMPWGNGTKSGDIYSNAMNSLINAPAFNFTQYKAAVNNFKTGSSVNTNKSGVQGLYKGAKVKPASENPLIKKFFPLF